MIYWMVILRLLHIVSGAFWVGTVVTAVFFIEPTAQALDREGERFLAHLVIRRRLALVLVIAATTAIGAGAILYWIDSDGLDLSGSRPTQGSPSPPAALPGSSPSPSQASSSQRSIGSPL